MRERKTSERHRKTLGLDLTMLLFCLGREPPKTHVAKENVVMLQPHTHSSIHE